MGNVFVSGTNPLSLSLLNLLFFLLLGVRSLKSLKLHRFKSDQDEIEQNVLQLNMHRLTESDSDIIVFDIMPYFPDTLTPRDYTNYQTGVDTQ